MNTVEKLALLRSKMQENNIGAFVVYSADPHLSEYLPKEWLERAWLSGFTGSAGFVVITDDKAGLWTDSRYFVQSAIELKGSGIDLFKDGVEGTPDYADWLVSVLPQGATVAVNALATSHVAWEKLQATLNANGLKLIHKPLLDTIWTNREKDPLHHIFVHPDKWAGQTVADKLKAIREAMAAKRTQLHLITALDDVAWTLNLRGSDVAYNPVFLGYIALTDKEATLFVDKAKLTPEVEAHLAKAQVAIRDYDAFYDYLSTVKGQNILLAANTNQAIFEANFVGESFGSIIGYQGNGAIVHYSAPEHGSKEVHAEGSILVDSGGQYLEGTTDITRTIPLGKVSQQFIDDSTLVLKGMIQLAMVQFPKGTRGVQLDAYARMALWKNHKDYGHGTGHGVGSFMNVHEGPQNIRKDLNPQVLLKGMVCSDEPGFYLEKQYGIRHENLVAVREVTTNEFGTFYDFETLTLCPFMPSGINVSLLTDVERQWLNAYHKTCEEKLAKHLQGEVKEWFLELVKPL